MKTYNKPDFNSWHKLDTNLQQAGKIIDLQHVCDIFGCV